MSLIEQEKLNRQIFSRPVFFNSNRVYRIYTGGSGFASLMNDDSTDGFFPEEWIASNVKAINPKYFGERDGVSVVSENGMFFDDALKQYEELMLGGRKFDCLVKYLDSAVRLPMQVHPTKEFARKYFNSEYGKTEAWLVLAACNDACLYFGFSKKIDKEILSELEEKSETEKDIMESILAKVRVKVGDVFLISAGLIHAIGKGCTILEVQEPTDFTIQPERWCADYHISDYEEYIGLTKAQALDCFDYSLVGEKALKVAKKNPCVAYNCNNVKKEVLIGYGDTPCFAENRYTLNKNGELTLSFAPSVWIVLEGEGCLMGENYTNKITKGEYFFLPYVAEGKYIITTDSNIVLAECLPSKETK